jgi:hypothetical protein
LMAPRARRYTAQQTQRLSGAARGRAAVLLRI